jgi:hypothetical protein
MGAKFFDNTLIGSAEQALEFIGKVLESSTEYSVIGKDLEGKILLRNEGACTAACSSQKTSPTRAHRKAEV